jgi:hypothetical protein
MKTSEGAAHLRGNAGGTASCNAASQSRCHLVASSERLGSGLENAGKRRVFHEIHTRADAGAKGGDGWRWVAMGGDGW